MNRVISRIFWNTSCHLQIPQHRIWEMDMLKKMNMQNEANIKNLLLEKLSIDFFWNHFKVSLISIYLNISAAIIIYCKDTVKTLGNKSVHKKVLLSVSIKIL